MGESVSVVVPTYNEAASLPLLLPRIRAAMPEAEIVVVDDDSPDGTGRLACRLSETYAPMRVVGRVGERGLATAVLRGIDAAQGDLCVVLDADLSHPPEAIPALVEAVRNGADLAIGSRYVRGGGTAGWPAHRRLASWAGGLLVRSLTPISDPLAGFFCVRKKILAGSDLRPRGFKILLEILVRARPGGVVEIPIRFVDRQEGHSKFGLRPTVEYLLQLARLHQEVGTPFAQTACAWAGAAVGWWILRFLCPAGLPGARASPVSGALALGAAALAGAWVVSRGTPSPRVRGRWGVAGLFACALLAGVAVESAMAAASPRSGPAWVGASLAILLTALLARQWILEPGTNVPSWRWCLAVGTVCRVAMAASVPVFPEEAYLWNFARHPDIGYLDHPPLIAWSIALGCWVFGDCPWGIRAVPLMLSVVAGSAMARLAARLYGRAAGAWAVLLFSLHPAVSGISASGFPEGVLLPFWVLTLACAWKAVNDGGLSWWMMAGASLGAAMFSKYTAVFLVPSLVLFLAVSPADRRWFRSVGPYAGSAVACLVFLPVLVWNATHDWASLRFESAGRLGELQSFQARFVARFLLEQWGAHMPVTLPLYVVAIWGALRSRRRADLFCLACAAPLLGFFSVVGCHEPVHILWPAAAYLSLHLLVAGALAEGTGWWARRYGQRPRALAGIGMAFLLAGAIHASVGLPGLPAFKGAAGWDGVVAQARALHGTMAPGSFYIGVGRKYACASMLAYGLRSPWDVEAGNLLGYKALQFEYWSVPEIRAGRDAVVVVERSGRTWDVEDRLNAAFDRVEPAGEWAPSGEEGARFVFYRAFGYRGRMR